MIPVVLAAVRAIVVLVAETDSLVLAVLALEAALRLAVSRSSGASLGARSFRL